MNYVAMQMDNNQKAFFELLRAGLWEKEARLSQFGEIDYKEVFRLAKEQSVVGLIAAGIEHIQDVKVPQGDVLPFVGEALQIEQQNIAMNTFVAQLIEKLRRENVYAILVKGQGVAQCYERPLWRTSGDIDLLLSDDAYRRAKKLLIPLATRVGQEFTFLKHLALTIDGWEVELHGTLYSRLSRRVDKMIDEVQESVFCGGNVRCWQNGNTQVFLPAPNEDVIFVFTHFLHHFFFEGVGLRQLCDWCRLLWAYRDSLNHGLLESRIRKMGLMTEWKAFAAYAVEWLGMPVDAMLMYDVRGNTDEMRWKKKACRIHSYIMKVGNMGHNQTSVMNANQPYWWRKFISFWIHAGFTLRHVRIFPKDSIVFFGQVFRSGLYAVVRGE